jgi:hypothetical protein
MNMLRHLAVGPIATAVLLLAAASAQAQTNYQAYQDFNSNGVVGTVVLKFSGTDANSDNVFDAPGITWQQLEFWGSINSVNYNGLLIYSGANLLIDPSSTWTIGDTNLGNANGFNVTGLASPSPLSISWAAGLINGFNGFPDPQAAPNKFGQLTVFDAGGNFMTQGDATTYANVGVVPEPSTYLMMAFGLAALAYAARRRAG